MTARRSLTAKWSELWTKPSWQVRYLSPFNFLIAPVGSPINNNRYEEVLEEAFKAILERRMAVEELADLFREVPPTYEGGISCRRALAQISPGR